MNFKFLFDYFRKCIKLCNEVSDISNNIRLYTYYDFLKSALVHLNMTIINDRKITFLI